MAGKNIVLLCDGTGNSAASLTKTNVWRLYRSLDLGPSSGQVARYSDGVGTSSFKPLALLGSIFGIGLSRNVVEMYKFLCRNWEPGDAIYAFGFSRGAFTARVLVGLIGDQGIIRGVTHKDGQGEIVPGVSDEELDLLAADAWRDYRRQFKLPIFSLTPDQRDYTKKDRGEIVGLVDLVRKVRDWAIRASRRGGTTYDIDKNADAGTIRFVGVWDTVSAYGLPLDELTRGIDDWIWPLSMPNYRLSEKVEVARHALALDEERDSFHPLLWDEGHVGKQTDLMQVWFAGVHSNVGGGYPDDSLSRMSLDWIMREASATGLRFLPESEREPMPIPDARGRMYDSRAGVGGYYRYQPRKIRSLLLKPPADTALLQDPKQEGKGFLAKVIVHHSVFDRIAHATDHYAPIGLPEDIHVLQPDGSVTAWRSQVGTTELREERQEWVWNEVWWRRINYFGLVGVSLLLACFPIFHRSFPPGACVGPQCLLTPLVDGLGSLLPNFLAPWIEAFAARPDAFLLVVCLIAWLMSRAATRSRRINDGSRSLWVESLGLPPTKRDSVGSSRPDDWVYRLRRSPRYQRTLQYLKWHIASGIFGAGLLAVLVALGLAFLSRAFLGLSEWSGRTCPDARIEATIATSQICNSTPIEVTKGVPVRLRLVIGQPWRDVGPFGPPGLPATPNGVVSAPAYMAVAVPVRRHVAQPWFRLAVRAGPSAGGTSFPEWQRRSTAAFPPGTDTGEVWETVLTPRRSGRLFLYVNDATFWPFVGPFYGPNEGTAELSVEPI